MLHRLPGRRTGFGGRVQAGSRIDPVAHLSHPLTLLDGFLQMRHSFLAMFIGERQRFENSFRMFRYFTAVMHDGPPITHPSVHDHFFGISEHRPPAILNVFRRLRLDEGWADRKRQYDNDEGLFESH